MSLRDAFAPVDPARPCARFPWREVAVLAALVVLSLPLVTTRIYASDEVAYSSYLRSLLKDGDLDFLNEYQHYAPRDPAKHAEWQAWLETTRTRTGLWRNVNPAGSSLLWAPAYLAVDGWLALVGSPARTGYERPYVRAICYSSVAYGAVGLLLLYGWMRGRARRFTATVVAAALWLGTNLFFYVYVTPPMSHANSFFLSTAVVVLWERTRERRSLGQWLGLGALSGLTAMVREQDALLMLLPGIDAALALGAAIRAGDRRGALRTVGLGLAALAAFAVVFAPQIACYRVLDGTFGPHQEATRKLMWTSPAVFGLLFSGWHGFFSWSPLAFPGLVGLVWLARRDPRLALPLLAYFALQVWTSSAYASWEAGASFGARRLIATLPVLAVGWVYLAERLVTERRWAKPALVGALALGTLWNVELIVQYATGMISRADPVPMSVIARNQVVEVPPKLIGLLTDYLTNRSRFYSTNSPP
ncbi:MAG: hypothetical protein U0610_25545 [bacterium]